MAKQLRGGKKEHITNYTTDKPIVMEYSSYQHCWFHKEQG